MQQMVLGFNEVSTETSAVTSRLAELQQVSIGLQDSGTSMKAESEGIAQGFGDFSKSFKTWVPLFNDVVGSTDEIAQAATEVRSLSKSNSQAIVETETILARFS